MTPGLALSSIQRTPARTMLLALLLAWSASFATKALAFGVDIPVVTALGEQSGITMVPDGAGGAILAWQDLRGGGNAIYAHHMLNSGSIDPSWPANGALLASPANSAFVLAMTTDGAGGAIVMWEDATTNVRAQRVRSNGVVDPVWGAAGVIVSTTAAGLKTVNAISDRAGGAFVVWRDPRNGSSNTDIYAMHLTGSGVDPAWPANGLAVCTAPLVQAAPLICSDGGSGAIVVWVDRRTAANDYDVYASHIRINGTVDPAWPVNGTAVVTKAGGQRFYSWAPQFYVDSESSDNQGEAVIPDGSGGCLVAWTDGTDPAPQDIYVQHVLSSGVVDPTWTAGGVAVCTAAGQQGLAYLISDGSGGAIAVWSDGRNGVTPDLGQEIYAQHVLATGAVSGPANGLPILTGGTGCFPHVIKDGPNAFSVFWTDRRDSSAMGYDLYAQHVVTSPSLAVDSNWPATGSAISAFAGDQGFPTQLWDGATGVIIAWTDKRDFAVSGQDIYAKRIPNITTSVASMLPASFALGEIVPNPFRDATSVTFDLARASRVRLDVFDLNGRRVRTISSGVYPAGRHEVAWDGRSDDGVLLGIGVYLVSMSGEGLRATRRATLLH